MTEHSATQPAGTADCDGQRTIVTQGLVTAQKIDTCLAVGNPRKRSSTSVMPVVLRANQQAWPLVRQTIDMNVTAEIIGGDIAIKIQKVESGEVLASPRQPGDTA